MGGHLAAAAAEVAAAAGGTDAAALAAAAARIAAAGRIAVHGCGREGLMMRALAMRLHHLGLAVGVVGEMTAPPVGAGDLLLASDGPGGLATVAALVGRAREAGAAVVLFTAEPGAAVAAAADLVVTIPAQTMARDQHRPDSALPMGSVYEGALLLAGEALVLALARRLKVAPAAMRARHANLE
ncbi:MAG: SIS domain-containing protein [Rhodobacteraceae bacterium]|nr:SIS domain-containing protein [Paracoccaceae bacterium]